MCRAIDFNLGLLIIQIINLCVCLFPLKGMNIELNEHVRFLSELPCERSCGRKLVNYMMKNLQNIEIAKKHYYTGFYPRST